jgi:threonylcarbamoyladenosine tRNA methylthiotransferase MtaB
MKIDTISFHTLGCRLNQSETAVLENVFSAEGYRVVGADQPADIVVINTCTVTEHGDADTRKLVSKINRQNPNVRIALIGCQAQVQKEKLLRFPNVRWVVGNGPKMDLARILKESPTDQPPRVLAPTISRDSFTIPAAGIDRRHTRANLKIQDGCDFFCSFCEIPYARGRARSREFNDILKEARSLAAAGHKEIVITGINVGTYANNGNTLIDVVTALEDVPDLERIRISSIEPTTIPRDLILKMSRRGKLCRYLHVPLQSGDNGILSAMKRKYTVEEFQDFIQYAAAAVPEICIGTDVIVGFPGEGEEQFERTYHVLLESPAHYFHVFTYSPRTMARSRHLVSPVAVQTLRDRSERLRGLSQRKRRIYYESLLGTTQHVLWEQNKGGAWTGVTDNYIRVKTDSNQSLENQLLPARLTDIEDQTVWGTIAAATAVPR